jgi:hypothetical protein
MAADNKCRLERLYPLQRIKPLPPIVHTSRVQIRKILAHHAITGVNDSIARNPYR